MIRTIKIKLEKTNELLQTIRIYNLACQKVLDYGYENKIYNKLKLNTATYHPIRKSHPTLPSCLVQTARDQASDMLKKDKFKNKIKKKQHSSIRFDKRTMKVFLNSEYCKLTTIFGRMEYKFKLANYYKKYINWKIKNGQLIIKNNSCYLHIQVENNDTITPNGDKRLGVDLGINNIAVCSDNTFHNSKHLKNVKGKYQHLKKQLQQKGTQSAKRKLKKIAGRERRFVADVNHCLAKELVNKPYDIIVFEDLINLKKRNMVKGRGKEKYKQKKCNKKLGRWSYRQLQTFAQYKAEELGKQVLYTAPTYTSQTCSKCGFKHKTNRNGKLFKCKKCSYTLDADLNAARNIATFSRSIGSRVSVNHPNITGKPSYKSG